MNIINVSRKCAQKLFKNRKYSMNSEVLTNVINKCGVITLNRHKVLNALNLNMINIIYSKLLEWQHDSNVNHIVIHGGGCRGFCAGGDIRQVTEDARSNMDEACKFFESEYKLNYLIATYNKPYIAILEGITMGGGFGLSVHGRYRLVTENTIFAMPETAIGLYPDVGGSYFLPRLPNYIGFYLGLTGNKLKGMEVVSSGVGTHFIPEDKINKAKEKIIHANDNDEIQYAIEVFSSSFKMTNFTNQLLKDKQSIMTHFSKSTIEGIMNSLSNSTLVAVSDNTFCQTTLTLLKNMSPTSLKITMRQLNLGGHLNLKECFKMEYRISCRCLQNHDFHEGVRSILIDKDNNPKWKPAAINEVSDEIIDVYFEPLPRDLVL